MNADVRDPRADVDRVLLAADLINAGQSTAAHMIVDSMPGALAYDLHAVADKLADYEETVSMAGLCHDDPRYFIDLYVEEPVPGSLLDYSEWRCAELDAEAAELLAAARALAEAIAAKANTASVAA